MVLRQAPFIAKYHRNASCRFAIAGWCSPLRAQCRTAWKMEGLIKVVHGVVLNKHGAWSSIKAAMKSALQH